MRAIEITPQDVEEIMSYLPTSLKQKLHSIIRGTLCDKGIHELRQFVSQYDEDYEIDQIIAFTCSTLIGHIMLGVEKLIEERKKEGRKGIHGLDAALVVCRALREEASIIEEAINNHPEHECSKH